MQLRAQVHIADQMQASCEYQSGLHTMQITMSCKVLLQMATLIIEANKMHYFSTLSWQITLHVLDRLTVHHQESFRAIGICHTEILIIGKITSVYTCTESLNCKTCCR